MTKVFRRILVPHDFSLQAMEALAVAVDLAAEHRGRVTVLHVVNPPPAIAEIAWTSGKALCADLRKRLASEVAAALGDDAPRLDYVVRIGAPVPAILTAARKADSIVMATLGHTGLAHWLLGSVAEKVVRLSPVPVLTIRPTRKRLRSRRKRTKS